MARKTSWPRRDDVKWLKEQKFEENIDGSFSRTFPGGKTLVVDFPDDGVFRFEMTGGPDMLGGFKHTDKLEDMPSIEEAWSVFSSKYLAVLQKDLMILMDIRLDS